MTQGLEPDDVTDKQKRRLSVALLFRTIINKILLVSQCLYLIHDILAVLSDMDEARVEFDYNRSENTTRHHTEEYENDVLILRRGETFNLELTFHNVGPDEIQESVLRFCIGEFDLKHPYQAVSSCY